MRWVAVIAVLSAFLFLTGCPEESCRGNQDCMNGYSCNENGKCVKTDPLRIVTSNIPDGVVGEEYQFTVVATGGIEPHTWVVKTNLGWLSMHSSSGNLVGMPTEVVSGEDVEVVVADSSYGEGEKASREFYMSVAYCSDTQDNACSGSGVCRGGSCDCDEGYIGNQCDSCDDGYHEYEGECLIDEVCGPESCSGHGTCLDSGGIIACTCYGGYSGKYCDECAAGYHDEQGECVKDEVCLDNSCDGHGTCDDSSGVVVCECYVGYIGDHCDSCSGGYHREGNECVENEACQPESCSYRGTCDDSTGVPMCTCNEGYDGTNCERCAGGYHDDGGVCVRDEVCLASSCSGHGNCDDNTGVVVCTCDDWYRGDYCEIPVVDILSPHDRQHGDNFGKSVTISGNYALIGSPREDGGVGNPVQDAGAVYLYQRTATNNWDEITKISLPDPSPSDQFGYSVAVSGGYALVGIVGGEESYFYKLSSITGWDDAYVVNAPDGESYDLFGLSVAISEDYAIVGAKGEDGGIGNPTPGAGAAYIFGRTGDNVWGNVTKVSAIDAQENDAFGGSVSISGDYAIVGAETEDGGVGDPLLGSGAAYVFRRTGLNNWDDRVKLVAPDAQQSDAFGVSVSISGDYAIVGAHYEAGGPGDPISYAGAAYIFRRTGLNNWDDVVKLTAPDAQEGDNFGISVSISGDTAIVGASWEDGGVGDPFSNAGAVYLYRRTELNTWDDVTKVYAPDAQAYDVFGSSVAIDGEYLIIGAYTKDVDDGNLLNDAGAAYVFYP